MIDKELENIYYNRPFSIRNADEYDLENILDLFIDPTDGLIGPFDFSNVIIKGKMGSGKTMYLRANYAYYLHTLVPCLIENCPIVLPVYIKLSDFQSIRNPEEVYNAILVKIVEEIISVCEHLKSAEELARLHNGALTLTGTWSTDKVINKIEQELRLMTADEYVEKIGKSFEKQGGLSYKFLNAFSSFKKSDDLEIKSKKQVTFSYVTKTCETLLKPFDGKLLILFDEIGSTSKNFFRDDENGDSYFETLMNQLRTLPFIRTKLAVYPNTSSDILKETRYGDVVSLECDVINHPELFDSLAIKIISLIERYVEKAASTKCKAEEVFEVSSQNQTIIEQLVNATSGNMRRLMHLLDSSMNEAFKIHHGRQKVTLQNVFEALKKQGSDMESLFQSEDVDFLINLSKLCKDRKTYKFTYPNKGAFLQKFVNNSEEYNIIEIGQYGTGRKGNVYYFDYAYCVYRDLPTHYIKNSSRIDTERSRSKGEPIRRTAQLTDELILQSALPGKIDGSISYLGEDKKSGFIEGADKKTYFFTRSFIIKDDAKKTLFVGNNVRFLPSIIMGETEAATEIEILS